MRSPFKNGTIFSWCLYDFANSSYSAVIAAVVFPVYYTKVIVGNETGLGDLWWGRAISLSMLIVAVSSPFLGGVADLSRRRKHFLVFYTLVSVLGVAAFAMLEPGMVLTGFVLIVVANIGMEGGLVFYNAYLPDIAPSGWVGRISAWGFGLGYAGSLLSLLLAIPLVRLNMFDGVWLMVSCFFLLFSLPMFLWVTPKAARTDEVGTGSLALSALGGLRRTMAEFRAVLGHRRSRRFLGAFFLYQDGVGTVIVFSSVFAATTLGFEASELIFLYIVVQLTALIGSVAMAGRIDAWGPRRVINMSLFLWISVTVAAYGVGTKEQFWGVATIAGLGLGTIQAASRALYANLIPKGMEAGYFGIYSLVGKTSSILGPLVFGYVSSTLGSQRPAILSVGAFFVAGALLLAGVGNEAQESSGED